jgi:glutathione synthase/RimK-type ligase-like ATP-grasp enzyme
VFFAYHRRSKPTGELLAAMLQLPHGFEPQNIRVESKFRINREEQRDILIRWGNRRDEAADGELRKVVNSCEAIKRCSDKLSSLELMDMAGINVPEYSDDPESLLEQFGYPILGRNRHHARGTDIKLVLQKRDLRRRKDYYVRYIPTNREYRIHVVGDEVIRVQGKYLDNSSEQVSHVRNYATGYRFRKPRMRLRPERLSMAVEAVKIHG